MPGFQTALLTASFTGLHLALQLALFFLSFRSSSEINQTLASVLHFPVASLALVLPAAWLPSLWGYIPFAINSVCWGLLLFLWLRRAKETTAVRC